MTLPFAASESIFPSNSDELRVESGEKGKSSSSLATRHSPLATIPAADLESIAAVNLDSFLPRNLPFADWLAEKARQTGLLDDARSQWLAGRVDELARQAHFLGAADPATFDDRDEVLFNRNASGRRGQRRPWIGPAVAAIGGIADGLQQSYPEIAATLRRHLSVLKRAAGGQA